MNDGSARADGDRLDPPLTEQSPMGTHVVITASRALYLIKIPASGLSSTVTRYSSGHPLLLDGEPLSGVRRFFFDAASGFGQVEWWKRNPADYDRPDRQYGVTVRTTSRVMLILSLIPAATVGGTPEWKTDDTEQIQDLLDGIRAALATIDTDADFIDLLSVLAEHGRDTPGSKEQGGPSFKGGLDGR